MKSGWGYDNNLAQYPAEDGVYPYPGEGNNVYLRLGIFTIEDGDDLKYQDFLVGQGWTRTTVNNITGGSLALSGTFYVGYWSDGHGCVNMSGGKVSAQKLTMCVDFESGKNKPCTDAQFNLSGSGHLTVNLLQMCNEKGSKASFSQTGGTLSLQGNDPFQLAVGASSSAEFTLSDDGDIEISAGGTQRAFAAGVGQNSTVSFKQTGGTFTVKSGAYTHFGYAAGSTATYDMTGGEFVHHYAANGAFVVGCSGVGILNVSGDALFSPTWIKLGESSGGSGTVNLGEGGTISVGVNGGQNGAVRKGNGSAAFNFDGGTLKLDSDNTWIDAGVATTVSAKGGTIDSQGHTFTINPVVSGEGTLTLTGGGTVVFAEAPTCNIKVVNGTSVSFAAKPEGALTVERGIAKLTTDATPDTISLGTAGFIEYDLSSITEAEYATNLAENVTITTTDNSPVAEHVIIRNGGCGWNVTYSGTTLSATSFDATTTKAGAFTIFTGYYNDEYRTDQVQNWVNGLTTDGTATEKVIVAPNVRSMKLCGHIDCGDFVMSGDLTVECRTDKNDNRLFCKSISGDGTLTFDARGNRFGYLGALYPTVAGINCDVNVPIVLSGDIWVRSASADSLLRFNNPVTIADKASIWQNGSVDPLFNDDVMMNGTYRAWTLSIAAGKTLSGCGTVTGNLAMGAGAKLAVALGENGAVSPLTVTGNANLTGATVEFSGTENVADAENGTEIVLLKAKTITGWERTVVEIVGKKWRLFVKDTDNGQALVAIKGIPGLIISFH